ncbi:MAG: hypothetical protein AAF961_04935 [Planctomycetota bacterium]
MSVFSFQILDEAFPMATSWHTVLTFAQEAVPAAADPAGLTRGGWIVMTLSIGTVLTLVTYCLYRVLTLPPIEMQDLRAPLEIDTGDTEDAD